MARFTTGLWERCSLYLCHCLPSALGLLCLLRRLAYPSRTFSAYRERIAYYAHELEQEPPHEIPERNPGAHWPGEGKLEIKDAILKYRPELPMVPKGLSMTVKGGEIFGIVGGSVS